MASISDIKKERGRPATGQGTPVLVRLQPDQLRALDEYRGNDEGRPAAIRRIIDKALRVGKAD